MHNDMYSSSSLASSLAGIHSDGVRIHGALYTPNLYLPAFLVANMPAYIIPNCSVYTRFSN